MIEKNLIFVGVDVKNKNEALEYMVEKLQEENMIRNDESFMKAVLARESQMSTNIGYGIAIPHGKSDGVYRPFVALLKPNSNVVWNEGEGLVDFIFMIGVPMTEGGVHLEYISKISKMLMHESFRNKLLKVEDSQSMYNLFKEEI